MADVLLSLPTVRRMVGLGKSAIYDGIAAGSFPAPVKIGVASRWVEAEVQAWIDARKAERNGDRNVDEMRAA